MNSENFYVLAMNREGEFETYDGPFHTKERAETCVEAHFGPLLYNLPRPALMIVQEVAYIETIPE